jgi:hypothetical protein
VKETALKLGSVWGLEASEQPIADALLTRAAPHLEAIGCHKALTLHPTNPGLAFERGNMLVLDDLSPIPPQHAPYQPPEGISF